MNGKPEFHGSDLEKIGEYFHISTEGIVMFGANVNPLGLSKEVKADLAAHLDIISSYPDRDYKSLKAAIAAYCHTLPEYIAVGNGSTELISLLISQRAPKKALVLGPTYSEYARELSLVGGTITYYHLKSTNDFMLDVDDFLKAITEDVELVILCNPNNPTSSAIFQKDMEKILAACRERNAFVMVDETYAEFAPRDAEISAIPLVPAYDNMMVIRGVSKYFAAPGLRFGYGITSNQAFLDRLLTHQNPWSLNSVAAYAGERMLQDTEYIQKTWDLINSERCKCYERLCSMEGLKPYPAYGNFMLVQITKDGVSSFDVFAAAIKEKMMIRDCSSFHSLNGEYVRFCFMKPEDNERLMDCLCRAVH